MSLYLLWADDNDRTYTDSGCQIDNFFLGVTAGWPVGAEVLPPDVVGPAQVTNGVFAVSFRGTPRLPYTIQFKDMMEGAWQDRATITASQTGLIQFCEPAAGVPQRFYRAVFPPR